MCSIKKQPPVVFYKKGVLKFQQAKFKGKDLCRNVLLLIKPQA